MCRPRLRSQKRSGRDSLGLEEPDLKPDGRFDLGKGQSVVAGYFFCESPPGCLAPGAGPGGGGLSSETSLSPAG